MKRHTPANLNPAVRKPSKFRGIIGQQQHPLTAEQLQHPSCSAVVALVAFEAKCHIRFNRVQTRILKFVGTYLVQKTNAPAFLSQVKNYSANTLYSSESQSELVSTIAAARAKDIPAQTFRMQPN